MTDAGLPKSVIALAIACAVAVLAAVALAVVVVTHDNKTSDINKELIAQLEQLVTQNRGPRGDDGLSAYEIWLSLGNTGTEEDFIESLRGERGSDGLNGQDGRNGAPGPSGASVGSIVCNGTSISFYSTTGKLIGNLKQVCVQ
jgi:hypothetical protein